MSDRERVIEILSERPLHEQTVALTELLAAARRDAFRTAAPPSVVRVLRIIEYEYDSFERMYKDRAHWRIQETRDFGHMRIRSTVVPAHSSQPQIPMGFDDFAEHPDDDASPGVVSG